MKKYQIQNSIGSGNFSTVFKGVTLSDQSPCAIKIMKSHHKIALRQAQLLRKLKHPNVISVIDFQQSENESRLIMEYVGINTLQLYEAHSYGLREEQVKCILFQVALGLSCVHSFGIIHRDIKPENILIDKKLAIVKLIDFGLAIDQGQVSTDYIATRWYRAPQNLLGTKQYTCAIDVFSLGCVIVQLYLGSPLFPGQNNIDQIYKIFNILGYPTPASWPKGYQKMMELGIRIGSRQKKTDIDLKSIMNPCDPRLVDIVQKMLQLNPKNRITCTDILKHQYFKDIKSIIPPGVYKRYQQDFLNNKPLSFKGFQPAKCSKNSSNELGRKFPQINFHNVSSKVKSPPHQNTGQNYQNNLKVIEKPQFLRQKKSSSVDSCFVNQSIQSINQKDKTIVNPTKTIPMQVNQQFNIDVINRKFSTPSLVSYLHLPQLLQKNHTSAIETKPKQLNQQTIMKNTGDAKVSCETIAEEQHNHQKTTSTIIPQPQINPAYSQPNLSKKLTPNTLDSQHKTFKPFFVPESARNTYPFIPNVPIIADQPQQNIYKVPMRMSPPLNMSYTNDQSFNSSQNYVQEQRKLPPNFVLKPFQMNQNFQKPATITQMDNSINSKIYRSFQTHPHQPQNYIQNLVKQDLNKRAKNVQPIITHPLQPITPRQNYGSPVNNIRRQQQTTSRPQIIYRSPNNGEVQNKPFLSPTHRFVGNTSPDNSFNMNRQRRMVAVNSPPIQPPIPFFSPTHRKF